MVFDPEHDYEKLIPKYQPKYTLFDKIVLTFIMTILTVCTAFLFLELFRNYSCLY
jgi:hypothetical protein